jgi:hypothetical protein
MTNKPVIRRAILTPPYCLICECYPDYAAGADDPTSTDRLTEARTTGGAVGGSGYIGPEPPTAPGNRVAVVAAHGGSSAMSFWAAFFLRAFNRRCTIEPADDGERGQLRLRSEPVLDRANVRVELGRHANPGFISSLGSPVCGTRITGLHRHAERSDGSDVNAWLVQQGWALATGFVKMYESEQDEAEAATRGIWAGTFTQPWKWRQEHPRRNASP